MDVTQVLKNGDGNPITQNKKALTLGDVLTQALTAHQRQLPAYQAFVTLAKADVIQRIKAGGELELSRPERALLLEIAGDSLGDPTVLAQVFEAVE